jgi:enoyl-CoA hydratase/carnithine racemase
MGEPMSAPVLYEVDDGVATITLNRPEERNRWGSELMSSLFATIDRLSADPDARVAILTGSGKAFSSGANLKNERAHATTDISQYKEGRDNSIYDAIMNCPKPVIGAINGPAVGAGATLALGCDIRLASTEARLRWPMASLGIIPANGTLVRLARVIGTGYALELTLSSRWVSADEALQMGLVNRVVPPDDLLPASRELARMIAANAPLSLEFIKESLYRGLDMGLRAAVHADRYRMFILYDTEDRKEASKAWLEGRQPQFKGR